MNTGSYQGNMGRFIAIVAAGLVLCVLCAGCASLQVSKVQQARVVYPDEVNPENFWPDNELKRAFARYWAYRYLSDSKSAFDMEAPHFREVAPRPRYKAYVLQIGRNDLDEINVLHLIKDTDSFVQINGIVKCRSLSGKQIEIHLKDKWVKVRGTWYHVLRDRFFFPRMS